jgi:hypothetical protein
MLEFQIQVHRLVLLFTSSIYIYFHRDKRQTLPRFIILVIVIIQSFFLFNLFNNRLIDSNPDLAIFQHLGLPRAYSSSQYRNVKRELFEKYHPDRGTSNLDKDQRLQAFQKIEHYLSFLADNRKRELLDKFNMSRFAHTADAE